MCRYSIILKWKQEVNEFEVGNFEGGLCMNAGAKELKNKALREWRRRNPDKVRAASERYWEHRAQRELSEEVNPDGSTGANQQINPDGR